MTENSNKDIYNEDLRPSPDPKNTNGSKSRKHAFASLNSKFFVVLLVSGCLCVALALFLGYMFKEFINSTYMTSEKKRERAERYATSFQQYVTENNVLSTDAILVTKWLSGYSNVSLVVFDGNTIILDVDEKDKYKEENKTPDVTTDPDSPSDVPDLPTEDEEDDEPDKVFVWIDKESYFTINFSDRTAGVSFNDSSENSRYTAAYSLAITIAAIIYFAVILFYKQHETNRILKLSRDVRAISRGTLDSFIDTLGNDEISMLAGDVDTMRNTILVKMEEKQAAWQANSDLITSMAHDIRTPLTSLLGYIELLESDSSGFSDEQQQYLRVCNEKTSQIKRLSDELFLYFLAFNKSEKDIELRKYDAQVLIDQLIGSQLINLTAESIPFTYTPLNHGITVLTNVDYLNRVLDNLFSNLLKYADRQRNVNISAKHTGHSVAIQIENSIGIPDEKTDSTGIGIKNCQNIMKLLRGEFVYKMNGGSFTVRLDIPTEPCTNEKSHSEKRSTNNIKRKTKRRI